MLKKLLYVYIDIIDITFKCFCSNNIRVTYNIYYEFGDFHFYLSAFSFGIMVHFSETSINEKYTHHQKDT